MINVTEEEYTASQVYATRRELAERKIDPESEESHHLAEFCSAVTARALRTMQLLQKRREVDE